MKTKTEWWIVKNCPGELVDLWDGPFKTKTQTDRLFNKSYRDNGHKQSFVVVKVTYTPQLPSRKV